MFSKKYFQDRPVLFLNLVVILGALINIVAVVLRINTNQAVAIIRYQVSLGLAGFERAGNLQLYSFLAMAALIAIVAVILSARLYNLKRYLSLLILSLSIIALFFNLIVSGAILNLQ
jgi:hypothetical protein